MQRPIDLLRYLQRTFEIDAFREFGKSTNDKLVVLAHLMNKSKVNNIVFLLSLSFFGCHESSEFFIGKWQVLTIVENNENFELKENWMHLQSNGTFTSYDGELNKTESGFWKYDAETNNLLIDGEEDTGDSSWNLEMRNDSLIFTSISDSTYLISIRLRE